MLTLLLALTTTLAHGGPEDQPRAERIIVRCKSEALIRGTSVLVRDVAEIRTPDAVLTARIGDIRLASRPALGFNRVFPQGDILRRLVSAGLSIKQLEMSGANEVVAQPIATVLEPKDLLDVASPVLRAVLDLQATDVEFAVQQNVKTLRVPPGRFDLALRAKLRNGRVRPSSAVIEVEVVVDEEVFKTIPVTYRLRHYVQSLKTARLVKKGEPLDQSNLFLERTEVSPGSNSHLTDFQLVQGMVVARDIPNNQTLRTSDFRPPAAVHRGDLVTLIASRGKIRVSTKAIALGEAPVGGRLQVRSISTNKVTQAVVYAPGIALIPN